MAESDKLKYVRAETGRNTFNERLDELDSVMGKVNTKNKEAAVQVLSLMDVIHSEFGDQIVLDDSGVPVNSQLAYLYKRIRKNANNMFKALGGAAFFKDHRQKEATPEGDWWWRLDQYLEQKRKKSFMNLLRGIVIFAVIAAVVVFLYQRFLAPPPEVRERLRLENEAMFAIDDGQYDLALEMINEALEFGPEEYSLWVQKGVLLVKLGENELAQTAYDTALALNPDQERFLIERIYNAMQVGLFDNANADIDAALVLNPESAEAYMFRGQILEYQGDSYGAIQAYEEASILAEEQENIELITTVRMRLAMLMQSAAIPTFEN